MDRAMNKLNFAVAVFVFLALVLVLYAIDIIVGHSFDSSWPGHARYHVALSGLHLITFAAVIAVVAIDGLRRRRRSAWITLAIASILGTASWPVARAMVGDPPAWWVQSVFAVALLGSLLALALSYKECFAAEDVR